LKRVCNASGGGSALPPSFVGLFPVLPAVMGSIDKNGRNLEGVEKSRDPETCPWRFESPRSKLEECASEAFSRHYSVADSGRAAFCETVKT
jgi:hypothetical protein